MAAWLDNVRFTPTAGGTTDWTFSSAITGYQSPAAGGVVNGRVYKYFAISSDASQWEVGQGAYNTGTGVLARTTVLYNSSGTGTATGQSGAGTKISFSAAPQVAIVAIKEDMLSIEEANSFTATQQNQAQNNLALPSAFRNYLSGLTLSTAGSSTTFSVATGCAADTTNADIMQLGSAISKTTSAWAVGSGNGGLDTGAIATNTWYHAWLIKRTDTQVVDVLVSLSASAPTMPANYTEKRRLGSMKTNGSSQWTKFVQLGDHFLWDTPVNDVGTTALSTTATLFTMSVPPGVQVIAQIRGYTFATAGGSGGLLVNSPDEASTAAGTPTGNWTVLATSTGNGTIFNCEVRTNTAQNIRAVANIALTNGLFMATYGWFDMRGRDG